ncbi:MAG: hypothetical protein K6F50_02035 [Kiritimatiellae bacterium]|nr:hypothetical protein [Kiritimatiellia bacterium]
MNKALHVFVYLFLIGVGVAIWYEYQLNAKRSELYARNSLMEEYLVKQISPLVEDGTDYDKEGSNYKEPVKETIELDRDPNPNQYPKTDPRMEDVLVDSDLDYDFDLEIEDHKTLVWGQAERNALRDIEKLDEEGKQVMKGGNWDTDETSADKCLAGLVKKLQVQKEQFAKTRKALKPLRDKLAEVVRMYNDLTPVVRDLAETKHNNEEQIATLTSEKTALLEKQAEYENQLKEKTRKIEDLNHDVEAAVQETAVAKEELEKSTKMVEILKKQIQDLLQQQRNLMASGGGSNGPSGAAAVTSLSYGDKGNIIRVDNGLLSAVVRFEPQAMKELKGGDSTRPIPLMELAVKRYMSDDDKVGEIVGRIRLRQEVPGKNWVICDILADWEQMEIVEGDTVFQD